MSGSPEEQEPTSGVDRSPARSSRPLNVARLWAGGLATAVVAALVALVGVLVVRVILRVAVYTAGGTAAFGGSATVVLCLTAAVAALVATGLAHLLLITTPRPLTYLSWIVGLATAAAVVAPFVTGTSLVLALGPALVHFVVGTTIGSLVITAARASRPPYLLPYPQRR